MGDARRIKDPAARAKNRARWLETRNLAPREILTKAVATNPRHLARLIAQEERVQVARLLKRGHAGDFNRQRRRNPNEGASTKRHRPQEAAS